MRSEELGLRNEGCSLVTLECLEDPACGAGGPTEDDPAEGDPNVDAALAFLRFFLCPICIVACAYPDYLKVFRAKKTRSRSSGSIKIKTLESCVDY